VHGERFEVRGSRFEVRVAAEITVDTLTFTNGGDARNWQA
jgi:hypothetical protein